MQIHTIASIQTLIVGDVVYYQKWKLPAAPRIPLCFVGRRVSITT